MAVNDMDISWLIFAWIYNQWASSYVLYYQFNANSSQKKQSPCLLILQFLKSPRKGTAGFLPIGYLFSCSLINTFAEDDPMGCLYRLRGTNNQAAEIHQFLFCSRDMRYDDWLLQKTTRWVSSVGLYSPASSPSAWWNHLLQVISRWFRFLNPFGQKNSK